MPRPVLRIERPFLPEMLAEAVTYIEGLLTDEAEVFEFGSGFSTLWLAERVKRVVFVESDPDWFTETERALRAASLVSKTKGVLVEDPAELAGVIGRYSEFDLVLVDCLDAERPGAVFEAMAQVKPGGWLVLDDSHWPMLQESRKLLRDAGWAEGVFGGYHKRRDHHTHLHQTSIFERPPVEEAVEPEAAPVKKAKRPRKRK